MVRTNQNLNAVNLSEDASNYTVWTSIARPHIRLITFQY